MHGTISTYKLLNPSGNPVNFILKSAGKLYDQFNGQPDQPHRHDYYTILLLERAKGEHRIDFKTYLLTDYSLFFIYPGQVHQLIPSERPSGWIINFSDQFLMRNRIPDKMITDIYLFNKHGETPPLAVSAEDFQNYRNIITQIEQYRDLHLDYKDEALGALLKLILIHGNTNCTLNKIQNPQSIETGNQLVRQFKALIDEHFKEFHKVADYARMLSVTGNYLNKSVKILTGKSAKEYILNRILLEAKRSLLFSDQSNKELAFQLGFEEPAHFSNFFKRYCGLSPQDFKNTSRQS